MGNKRKKVFDFESSLVPATLSDVNLLDRPLARAPGNPSVQGSFVNTTILRATPQDAPISADSSHPLEGNNDEQGEASSSKKAKVNNTVPPRAKMEEFIEDGWAQQLLDVMRDWESDSRLYGSCTRCMSQQSTPSPSTCRCRDCVQPHLMCRTCFVAAHVHQPFHQAVEFNGNSFERKTLSDLGLQFHLGHEGQPCPVNMAPDKHRLLLVHTNGIHVLNIHYCRCAQSVPRAIQLWAAGLFPASFKRPQSAFSEHLLRDYNSVTLQGKITAHDYWESIQRKTDNTFSPNAKDRYRELMTAYRQWMYLMALKRHPSTPRTGSDVIDLGSNITSGGSSQHGPSSVSEPYPLRDTVIDLAACEENDSGLGPASQVLGKRRHVEIIEPDTSNKDSDHHDMNRSPLV